MTDLLQCSDIETVLKRFGAAIARDQARVDARPREKFHPSYDDAMWRDWRNGHRIYLSRLASTVPDMQLSLLEKVSAIARLHKHEIVRTVILEIFSEVVGGHCDQQEYATASHFFGGLTKQIQRRAKVAARGQCAKVSLARWFPLSDPLRIAADPECLYGPTVSLALLIDEIAPSANT